MYQFSLWASDFHSCFMGPITFIPIKSQSTNTKLSQPYFQKKAFKINKFKDRMSYPLTIYKNKNEFGENKKLIEHLERILLIKLKNWKEYKPTRGIIEDFFKAAKGAFGFGKFNTILTNPCTKTSAYAYY